MTRIELHIAQDLCLNNLIPYTVGIDIWQKFIVPK